MCLLITLRNPMPISLQVQTPRTRPFVRSRVIMSKTPAETIAQRFQKAIQSSTDRTAKEEYLNLTLEELGLHPITFGKEKKGQQFQEVVQKDPRYVAWFVSTYKDSDKTCHQKFIHYVKLFTEDLELKNETQQDQAETTLRQGGNTATPGAVSKAKAMHRPSTSPGITRASPPSSNASTPRSDAWELIREETVQQNQRVTAIEGALTQIVGQLQLLSTHLGSTANAQ